jgi:hypothetical protein
VTTLCTRCGVNPVAGWKGHGIVCGPCKIVDLELDGDHRDKSRDRHDEWSGHVVA